MAPKADPVVLPRRLLVLTALLSGGCAGTASRPDGSTGSGAGNAIVIEDEAIDSSRGTLLTIMQDHVRGMTVNRSADCPHIVLRGGMGRSQAAEALVYIDGQRFSDTCVLDTVNLETIATIEVYPSGVTNRPGYFSNSGGLILVFTKSAPAREAGPF
jgi:hypothetical protein